MPKEVLAYHGNAYVFSELKESKRETIETTVSSISPRAARHQAMGPNFEVLKGDSKIVVDLAGREFLYRLLNVIFCSCNLLKNTVFLSSDGERTSADGAGDPSQDAPGQWLNSAH